MPSGVRSRENESDLDVATRHDAVRASQTARAKVGDPAPAWQYITRLTREAAQSGKTIDLTVPFDLARMLRN
jgi:hypothetical protein